MVVYAFQTNNAATNTNRITKTVNPKEYHIAANKIAQAIWYNSNFQFRLVAPALLRIAVVFAS